MPAPMAGSSPVADLVPVETGRVEPPVGVLVHRGGSILVLRRSRTVAPAARAGSNRQVIARRAGQALGVGVVERQGIQREVVRLEVERGIERPRPAVERLAREVVQEVEAQRCDAGVPGCPNRCLDVGRLVSAPERRELPGVEALRADGQAGHAGGALGLRRRLARRDRG